MAPITAASCAANVELGKRNPSILVLNLIAVALGVDITELTKR